MSKTTLKPDDCFCSCRSKLLCWEQGDPSRWACEHRWEDCVLLHLQGWNMAHPPPGHMRTSPPAQSNPQHTHWAPQRRGNQSRIRETVSQTRSDTLSWKIETRYLHLWNKNTFKHFSYSLMLNQAELFWFWVSQIPKIISILPAN